jgi:preprotein translocase subunit SecG
MTTILLLIHLLIAIALVGVVLLQRSEGGGLGIGGGGGSFMTGRGTANFLTRITVGLAAAFFVTSIGLTLLARNSSTPKSILTQPPGATKSAPAAKGDGGTAPASAPASPAGSGGVLESLEKGKQRLPKSQ